MIAEIKRRSPSKGVIRKSFDPPALAKAYEKGGARALSVLTDEKFFGGSLDILKKVRRVTDLPILRKDFVVDEYQIFEAAAAGADAILLIAAVLDTETMKRFSLVAKNLKLDIMYEVHNESDLKRILPLKPKIVGINNRDLRTFLVDLKTTAKLCKKIPSSSILVSESGIFTVDDIKYVQAQGASAVLVGESLMRQRDVTLALQRLLGVLV